MARAIMSETQKYYFMPFGIWARGVCFPTLEKVAEDFAKNNELSLVEMTDFNTHDLRDASVALEDLHNYTEKILQFDNGLAILKYNLTKHGLNNLEATFGGGPMENYNARYILSGKIGNRSVQLLADVRYSRPCIQEQKTREFPLQEKYFGWVPKGDFRKEICRWDREKFWFLTNQEK